MAAIAAAGVIAGGPGWATSEESWSTLIDVNLHGARRLAEATVPGMIAARRGRFVAVASAAALRAMPQLAGVFGGEGGDGRLRPRAGRRPRGDRGVGQRHLPGIDPRGDARRERRAVRPR